MLIFSLFWSLLILSCASALWVGGRDSRIAATIVFAFPVVDFLSWLLIRSIADLWIFPATLDVLQLVSFAALMLRSRRWWPVWLTGFQIDAVLAQLSGLVAPDHAAAIFRGLHTFWCVPILIVLVLGAILDRRASFPE